MKTRTNLSAAFLSLVAVAALSGSALAGEPVKGAPKEGDRPAASTAPADFNLDGEVGMADIFDFLNSFFAGKENCDADGDGQLSGMDVLAYINIWFGYTIVDVRGGK